MDEINHRGNKKEAVAALHRERILTAAEQMFSDKGFVQTTIADISAASEYSRRTIYAYYESKEDILHHIIAKGLSSLKEDLEGALQENNDFLDRYFGICNAMKTYQTQCPHSLENVTGAQADRLPLAPCSPAVSNILSLGTQINELLAAFIQTGKDQGVVRQEVLPMPTVYILWSSITSLLTLVSTKGTYIAKAFSTTEEAYLDYGFKQIINSILEVRIS